MTKQNKATLQGYFNTGDIPTETQFANLVDSVNSPGATLTIAANDATQRSKDFADYVCDGTNDEVQIQAAIDALPAGGGKVLLSEGTYNLSWVGEITQDGLITPYCVKILPTHPAIAIEGVPGATILKLADSQPRDTSHILIRGSIATQRTNPVSFVGLVIEGNGINQSDFWQFAGCITVCDADHVTVNNCRFQNWYRNGLCASWTSTKIIVSASYFYGQGALRLENHNYTIVNNIFEDPHTDEYVAGGANVQICADTDRGDTSMMCIIAGNNFIGGRYPLLLNGTQNSVVMANTFIGQSLVGGFAIYIAAYDGGIGFRKDVENNTIIGNVIYDCNNGICLTGSDAAALGANHNMISNNIIAKGPTYSMSFGILEGWGTTHDNTFTNNYIDPTIAAASRISAAGVNDVIHYNLNYVTENKGAAAAIGDGGTIDHGLVTTPTVATVSGSVAGEIVTVTTLDATHITVAIKKHDGSAGTAQTVYWRAYV